MKRICFSFFAMLLLLGITSQSFGKSPFRLGRVSSDDFIQGAYEKDPDASAVILYDYGYTSFDYCRTNGFFYNYRREMRIQILNEQGFDWANFEILLSEGRDSRETISRFSGFVHNLNNNQVRTTKINQRSGMTEQTTPSLKTLKFSYPEVRAGSIVEIGYTKKSFFIYNLPRWQFQYSIPVEYSEYNTAIPEFFSYQFFMQGYESASETTQRVTNKTINFSQGNRMVNVPATQRENRWVFRDVPAMRSEPFTNSIRNYLTMIFFELAAIQFPHSRPELFISSWADIDKRMNESDDFGGFLSGSRQMRQEIGDILLSTGEDIEKIEAAIKYVQSRVRWNGNYGIWATDNPRQVLRQGDGNVADVNLMLVAVLRHMGFDANPVVSSTRNNGIIITAFPTISRFNYVLAHVRLPDRRTLVLDATDPLCPPGMLPVRALNGNARIIAERAGSWIDLKPQNIAEQNKNYLLSIAPCGTITATAEMVNSDYSAYSLRRTLQSSDLEKYTEDFQGNITGLQINSLVVENQLDLLQPLIKKMEFNITDGVTHTGDMIFFNPLLFEAIKNNPFRIDERKYPVDFTVPQREKITMVYDIPEGFEVDFLPAPMRSNFKNQLQFNYSIVVNDQNQIVVDYLFEIRTHLILPDDYNGLKNFYNRVVEKQNEQIVLKSIG
jgi:plasmid maintenance system killer protein